MSRRTARVLHVVVTILALWATSCAGPRTPVQPTLILIGVDGFGADYLERTATPNLDRLVAGGVRAERLIVTFPSMTFPSFYTIATGLRPEHHGIISNTMYDEQTGARFHIRDSSAVGAGDWWGGEPIWVTAVRQGRRSAAYFWPGTEAPIGGVRPTYWHRYDGDVPNAERVRQVLDWLDLPDAERPTVITLYFSDVDETAHDHPPTSPAVDSAIRRVDNAIGLLLSGLDNRGITNDVNIIVVSDHGMAPRSPERVIFLDDYLDWEAVDVIDWHPVLAIRPEPNRLDEVHAALAGQHPHLAVYRREELPDRLHYQAHHRIAPIIAVADPGWSITSREFFERNRSLFHNGTHGYDPRAPTMGALLVAAGPAFRRGLRVPALESVHLYELMCHVLGLVPAPNDGALDSVRALLRHAR